MKIDMKSKEFAEFKHRNQLREDGKPYFTHLEGVVDNIIRYKHTLPYKLQPKVIFDDIVAAGYLHDIIEDTDTTLESLKEKFSPYTCKLVDILTRRPTETYYDFILRIRRSDYAARYIKCCDIMHNMSDADEQEKMGSRYAKYQMALYILDVL